MHKEELTSWSKFLSLVLRHQPEVLGIALDAEGWTAIDLLLQKCEQHRGMFTRAMLDEVVQTNAKKRFAISEDGTKIRASQGHSIDIDVNYDPQEPPAHLFHGTVAAALDAIRREGLSRMQRNHVHLSSDEETARVVAARRGKPVILKVRAGEMHREGIAFFLSANGVWLTKEVPVGFIELF